MKIIRVEKIVSYVGRYIDTETGATFEIEARDIFKRLPLRVRWSTPQGDAKQLDVSVKEASDLVVCAKRVQS